LQEIYNLIVQFKFMCLRSKLTKRPSCLRVSCR